MSGKSERITLEAEAFFKRMIQRKDTYPFVMLVLMVGASFVYLIGLLLNIPAMFYLTSFSFLATLTALFCNTRILNSVVIGLLPIFSSMIPAIVPHPLDLEVIGHACLGLLIWIVFFKRWRRTIPAIIVLMGVVASLAVLTVSGFLEHGHYLAWELYTGFGLQSFFSTVMFDAFIALFIWRVSKQMK